MKAVIICGGEIRDYQYLKKYLEDADIIIAADSGVMHCRGFGVVPHILLGDFDSSCPGILSQISSQTQIVRFPIEKDMTDSELAANMAIEKGADHIVFLGAIGTRTDHTLANIFMLKKLLDKGVEAIIADEKNEIRIINKSIRLKREEGCFISLLPLNGSARGVTISGFYYPLVNATLEVGSSWGVSNIFTENEAQVTLEEGYLLVIKSWD